MSWQRAAFLMTGLVLAAQLHAGQIDGARALADVKRAVSYGPRPAGSEASKHMLAWIEQTLRAQGWEVVEDRFTAVTPAGSVPMMNLIARRSGLTGRAVAVSGHTDTKRFPFRFVGANDGGSSTGLLLELARALKNEPLRNDVWLVFLDGEEAIGDWSATDSVYGSRHLAAKWAADGTLKRLAALINVDMIGDRDLHIVEEYSSTPSLRRLLRDAAARSGHADAILRDPGFIEDDHMPFLHEGAAAIDLIDFDYGPRNSWWHSEKDTLDKLSAKSLKTVGEIVMEMLRLLEPGAAAR
jgi:Zn-dependent M28 family amino/carboxypeptidase